MTISVAHVVTITIPITAILLYSLVFTTLIITSTIYNSIATAIATITILYHTTTASTSSSFPINYCTAPDRVVEGVESLDPPQDQ